MKTIYYFTLLLTLMSCFSDNPNQVKESESKIYDSPSTANLERLLKKDSSLIYLNGEVHRVQINDSIKLMYLKYLNEFKGVRYIILEGDHGLAYSFNQFLEKDSLTEQSRLNYPFLHQVCLYNRSLQKDHKVRFIGLDIALGYWNTARGLEKLTKKYQWSSTKEELVFEGLVQTAADHCNNWLANGYNEDDRKKMSDALNLLVSHLKTESVFYNETLAQKLGDEFFDLKMMIKALDDYFKSGWGTKPPGQDQEIIAFREKAMIENMNLFHHELNSKYFGQMGSNHVSKDTVFLLRNYAQDEYNSWNDGHSLARVLNSDHAFQGKVYSTVYAYYRSISHQYQRRPDEIGVFAPSILKKSEEDTLRALAKTNQTVFDLKGNLLPRLNKSYDALVLIQNSGYSTPEDSLWYRN
ncbi:MAG: erythromycin esterase family protein [Flavobacteriales bacterium]|nr:erythromycin esterase family protein [Flavobacteriales bacterium]